MQVADVNNIEWIFWGSACDENRGGHANHYCTPVQYHTVHNIDAMATVKPFNGKLILLYMPGGCRGGY